MGGSAFDLEGFDRYIDEHGTCLFGETVLNCEA